MEDVSNIRVTPLQNSQYVKPFRFLYNQNGKEKTWDLLAVHNSIVVVIFNVTRKVLVLLEQFRPAVYYNCVHPDDRQDTIDTDKYPTSLGLTLELCAGIVDKNRSLKFIAREEVLQKCGYDVPAEQMEKLISCRTGVGEQAAEQTFFFCEVTDSMQTGSRGGFKEYLEIVEKTIPEMEEMLNSQGPLSSPPSLLFAMLWFFHYKAAYYTMQSTNSFKVI